jgi:von Willebrand factor type A C-terminal domain
MSSEDLTGRGVPSGPQAAADPTGAWGASESRDRHVRVRVTPAGVGQEMLAEESGNQGTAKLLARVADVVDAVSGTVRLKKRVDDADEMALHTRSTKTVRTRK